MSSKPTTTTFYELCRLCLESPGSRALSENIKLLDDIYCFTGVKVASNDNLPQTICKQCLRTIKKMKALKTLTNTNDTHLKFLFDEEEKTSADEKPECSGPSNVSDLNTKPNIKPVCQDCGCHKNSSNTSGENTNKQHSPKKPSIAVRKDLFIETLNSIKDIAPENPKEINKKLKQRVADLKKVKVESSINDTDYKCKKCNKVFTEWKKFYHHERQHNPSVMCPFDACLKKFTTKHDLAKHVRTHTGEKPYKCSFCEKRFTQKVTMKQHELCHYKAKK